MENTEKIENQNNTALIPIFNYFDTAQFDVMMKVSRMYAQSELVPDIYKISNNNNEDKAIANCMIAIELSQRMGLSPFTIMQNMKPIQGQPSFASKFIISRINGCGKFKRLQWRFTQKGNMGVVTYIEYQKEWIVDQRSNRGYYRNNPIKKTFDGTNLMDVECVAYTTAIDNPDNVLESQPVSLKMAIEEGWYFRNGSKWQTMPTQMLMYRTASFWVNAHAPELVQGIKTTEEQQDIVDVDYTEVTDNDNADNQQHIVTVDTADMGGDVASEATVDTETGEIIEKRKVGNQPGF